MASNLTHPPLCPPPVVDTSMMHLHQDQHMHATLGVSAESRELNARIKKLHERALRCVYKEKNLTFEQLLEKDNAFTIHERNLQKLAIEMYKVKNDLCPKTMKDLFVLKTSGNDAFALPKAKTVNRGLEP